MADIALGHGSKWLLLKYLGWHRNALNAEILDLVPSAEAVEWLDFPSGDAEWESFDFMEPDDRGIRDAWRKVWPHGRGIQTWDAVGRIRSGEAWEWLLVEAKAHTGELESTCGARGGLDQIKRALTTTKAALGVSSEADWLTPYYQYANRVVALHFLVQNKIPARLLFIYFLGDGFPGRICPIDESAWQPALDAQAKHVGLPRGHQLEERIHRLFLPARRSTAVPGRKESESS